MSDLISRKHVVKELLKEREHYPPMVAERYSLGVKTPYRFNQAMRGGIRKALRIVETAPTADDELLRQLEQVTKERDAAVADLRDADYYECEHCAHYDNTCAATDCYECQESTCPCKECINLSNWEWRGVREGENGRIKHCNDHS